MIAKSNNWLPSGYQHFIFQTPANCFFSPHTVFTGTAIIHDRIFCMKQLKIGLIDLVSKGPTNTLWARIMHANLASIMPQVIAVWCEEQGHEVQLVCYTGSEKLDKELQQDVDLVFICAFTQAALLAYSISNYFRSKG